MGNTRGKTIDRLEVLDHTILWHESVAIKSMHRTIFRRTGKKGKFVRACPRRVHSSRVVKF